MGLSSGFVNIDSSPFYIILKKNVFRYDSYLLKEKSKLLDMWEHNTTVYIWAPQFFF